jgi:hypothetical protein
MAAAGATQTVQNYDIVVKELAHGIALGRQLDAGFLCPAKHLISFPAKFEHLWHERKPIKGSPLVKSLENIGGTSNLYKIPSFQSHLLIFHQRLRRPWPRRH